MPKLVEDDTMTITECSDMNESQQTTPKLKLVSPRALGQGGLDNSKNRSILPSLFKSNQTFTNTQEIMQQTVKASAGGDQAPP